jgi:hypothetical protein
MTSDTVLILHSTHEGDVPPMATTGWLRAEAWWTRQLAETLNVSEGNLGDLIDEVRRLKAREQLLVLELAEMASAAEQTRSGSDWLSCAEIGRILLVRRRTVWSWGHRHGLRMDKSGPQLRVNLADLRYWLERHRPHYVGELDRYEQGRQ